MLLVWGRLAARHFRAHDWNVYAKALLLPSLALSTEAACERRCAGGVSGDYQACARVTDDLMKREAARLYAQKNRVPGAAKAANGITPARSARRAIAATLRGGRKSESAP